MLRNFGCRFGLGLRLVPRLMLAVTLLFMSISHVAADRLEQADRLVLDLLSDAQSGLVAAGNSAPARMQVIENLIDAYFDFAGIARASTGQYWRAATPDQRQRYITLFKSSLMAQVNTQFDRIETLEFQPQMVKARGTKFIFVTGILHDKSGEIADILINWRLSALPDRDLKIIDIEVENISMLKSLQEVNTALLRRNGGDFEALITSLKDKTVPAIVSPQ